MRLLALVLLVAAAAEAAPDPAAWHDVARYAVTYRARLDAVAEQHPSHWRVWVPYPAESPAQHVRQVRVDADGRAWRLETDARANRMVYLEGDGAPPAAVTLAIDVERRPSDGVRPAASLAGTPLDPERWTKPDTLVPLTGVIQQISDEQGRGRASDAEKMQAFYDYVVATMRYDKSGTGWGNGDAVWACANKRGNCTDFHSLLIGLARAQHIPARFLIGFPIPSGPGGDVPGYHCWAEWWDRTAGWTPLDASEANKSGWWDAYYGWLPNDRVEFSTGRDLVLAPPQDGPPVNYFIHPYAEADGRPVAGLKAEVSFTRQPPDAPA